MLKTKQSNKYKAALLRAGFESNQSKAFLLPTISVRNSYFLQYNADYTNANYPNTKGNIYNAQTTRINGRALPKKLLGSRRKERFPDFKTSKERVMGFDLCKYQTKAYSVICKWSTKLRKHAASKMLFRIVFCLIVWKNGLSKLLLVPISLDIISVLL